MIGAAEKNTRKEYFTACVAAILTSTLGMLVPEESGEVPKSLALLGIIALFMIVGLYYRVSRDGEERSGDGEDASPSFDRMRRMAYLWYALTLVLAGTLIRGPLRQMRTGSLALATVLELLVAGFGFIVIGFALWKLLILGKKK